MDKPAHLINDYVLMELCTYAYHKVVAWGLKIYLAFLQDVTIASEKLTHGAPTATLTEVRHGIYRYIQKRGRCSLHAIATLGPEPCLKRGSHTNTLGNRGFIRLSWAALPQCQLPLPPSA